MDLDKTARCLAELGHVARLRLFALLVRAGDQGLTITELRRAAELPASTLAHHLRGMVGAGIVTQQRQGREVRCTPDFRLIDTAWRHFRAECCQGPPQAPVRPPVGSAGAGKSLARPKRAPTRRSD